MLLFSRTCPGLGCDLRRSLTEFVGLRGEITSKVHLDWAGHLTSDNYGRGTCWGVELGSGSRFQTSAPCMTRKRFIILVSDVFLFFLLDCRRYLVPGLIAGALTGTTSTFILRRPSSCKYLPHTSRSRQGYNDAPKEADWKPIVRLTRSQFINNRNRMDPTLAFPDIAPDLIRGSPCVLATFHVSSSVERDSGTVLNMPYDSVDGFESAAHVSALFYVSHLIVLGIDRADVDDKVYASEISL